MTTTPMWTRRVVLWLGVLSSMAVFQLWRGAWVDGAIFVALVTVLVVDRATHGRIKILRRPINPPKWTIYAALAVLGSVLVFTPRGGVVDLIALVLIGLVVLVVAWVPTPKRRELPEAAHRRSAMWWTIFGVVFCVWEALAFIFSTHLPGFEGAFPTVSVLLDPVLSWIPSRAAFVALWLMGGLTLLRIRSRR